MDTGFSFEEAQTPEPAPEPAGFSFEEAQQPQAEAGFSFAEAQDQSVLRQVADVPLKVGAGAIMGVRMIANAFGAGSEASKALKGAEDWIADLFSAQSKNDSQEVARIMKKAEDAGVVDQVKAGLQAFFVAPIDFVAQGLGTAAPTILAALGAKILGAGALATTAITAGLGVGMGAGTVKGSIYDAVKEELKKTNMPEDQIEARAKLAQEYGGENLDQILMGAAIGGIAARTGLEKSIAQQAAARITGKAAAAEAAETAAKQQAAEEAAKIAARGPIRQGARVAGAEAATEFPQGAQEQAAQNIALQREGFEVPTMRGVVGAGTLEALAAAPLGAGFGAREAMVARQQEAKLSDINELIGALKTDPDIEPEQRVAEQVAKLQATLPKPVADQLATRIEAARAETNAEAERLGITPPSEAVDADPARVQQIEDEYIAEGVEPAVARAEALAQATEEAYADWTFEQQKAQVESAQGEQDVGPPVTPTGREGVPVAGEPSAGPPAGGVRVTEPSGVVPTAEDVGVSVAREEAKPSAVETVTPAPDLTRAPSVTETPQASAIKKLKADLPNMTDDQLEDLRIGDVIGMESPEASELIRAEYQRRQSQKRAPSVTETLQAIETKEERKAAVTPAPAAVAPKEVGIKSDKFAAIPSAEKLYRASTAQTKYPGKFWTSLVDYANRYLKKGTDREQRALEETTEFPKRTLNVTTLSEASQAERDAILADFQAWLTKNAPNVPIEDTQLYEVLVGDTTDFAYPQRADTAYLKSKGYDSLFFAKEGGEDVNTWFVFDKRKRATKEEMEARPKVERAMAKRGRRALEPEDKAEAEQSNKEKRALANRNNTKLNAASTLLRRAVVLGPIDGKSVRNDGLHMLYDVYATAPYTPQKNRAAELLAAQGVTTPADRDALKNTHEAWKAKQEQRQQTEAEKKARTTAKREAEKAEREAKRAAREAAPAKEAKAPGKPGRPRLSEEEIARRKEEAEQKREARKKAVAERRAIEAKKIEIARQEKEKKEAKKAKPTEDKWAEVKRTTRGTVELVPTSSLNGVQQRNKTNTESDSYFALKASIVKKGIVDPIILAISPVTGAIEVFEGNHRLQVARELGIAQVPVVLHERINRSETVPIEGRKPSSVLFGVATTAKPAPKEQSAQEQYTGLTKDVAGAPEFSTLPDTVKDQIADLAKRGELNLAAISRIIAADQSPLPQIKGTSQPPNPAFGKFTTAAQAASYITRTGNFFQKLLAYRLLNTVKKNGTKFVVLEEGDPTPAIFSTFPNSITWAGASGVFVRSENTIYVRGESFGSKNGVNTTTVLHELLHAATAERIRTGQSVLGLLAFREKKETTELSRAVQELDTLMQKAGEHYRALEETGKLPADVKTLVESLLTRNKATGEFDYTLFTNLDEFLAYGMSHPTFQNFLKDAPGFAPKQSVFSQFVELIRRIFGIPKGQTSALLSLADVTDRLISEPMVFKGSLAQEEGLLAMKATPTVVQAAQQAAPAAAGTQKKAKAQSKKVSKTLQKVLRSHSSGPTAMDGIKELVNDRQEARTILLDSLVAGYKSFKGGSLRQLLPTLQTETFVEWAGRLGLNNVVQAWGLMKDMDAAQVRMQNTDADITERMVKLQLNNPIMYRALAATMHYSTLREIDPATEEGRKKAPALAKLWFRLNPEAKQIYVQVRDAYVAKYDQHFQRLSNLINSYPIEGNEADASTPKGNLIASIRKMQETGRGIKPYFPLMRYGNFWVRTGKGANGSFYMFESQKAKELFIQRWFREQKVTDPSAKLETLYTDGVISDGNDISSAREDIGNTSALLKRMFDNIDTMKTRQLTDEFGNELPQYAQVTKEQLKNDIYQLVLHTLPDASFRKQFIHRQGKEGFSEDIARNYATLSTAMGRQLARLQYAPQITNAIASAQSALKGNPDAAKLGEFVKEMRLRAQLQLDPAPENAVGNGLANFANQTAFLYMMTNVKTAVAQLFALPTFTAPVLASNYGIANTVRVMGSFGAIWNSLGMRETAPDGTVSWVAPTIARSKNVKLNPEERRAAQYMIDRGLSDTTLAYDLGNRKKSPTAVQNSTTRRAVRSTVNFMGALFHHTERLVREVTFMSAFRLAREQNPNASFEEIALRAEKDTYTALNNFSSINRPRGVGATAEGDVMLNAHKPWGRAILQFKMFPAFVTTYFVRNFYRMVGPEYSKAERKQAFTQFFGTLMMSMTLAGTMGIPGFSFVMGVLSGLRNMTMGEDEDDPLEKRDLELWFRNVWMQDTFGDVKVGGKPLADILDRGVIPALTGFDFTSSLSMNNMWFPEMKETATAQAAMHDYALSMAGPFASLTFKQFPKAIDYFNQGKVVQGVEQLLPAMARSPVTAYRYATEGATTTWGADIKSDDEYKVGHIIGQALGFGTEGLVARREDLFKAQSLVMRVKNEKRKLMDRLDLEYRGDSGDVDTAIDKIVKFNAKNPFDMIKPEELSDSLIQRIERRAKAERGVDVEEKYYPQLQRLLEPSRRKLETEAQ